MRNSIPINRRNEDRYNWYKAYELPKALMFLKSKVKTIKTDYNINIADPLLRIKITFEKKRLENLFNNIILTEIRFTIESFAVPRI